MTQCKKWNETLVCKNPQSWKSFWQRGNKDIIWSEWRRNYLGSGMVFCYQNCSDLLWEKKCSNDREKLLKFEAEGREFAKILRSLEQFNQTVKGQNNFW